MVEFSNVTVNNISIAAKEDKGMKIRLPICFISAVLCTLTYVIFTIMSYTKNPQQVSPLHNWLSDLGNQITNPQGAIFYNLGVILCALFLAIWFVAGLSQWRLRGHIIQQRLLVIAQVGGVLTAFALMMSALYPINHLSEHALWSDINFILFGISFAFSVVALRYSPHFPKSLLFIGGFAAIMPTLVLFINSAYWLEWVAVGLFLIYILAVGASAWVARLALAKS